MTASSFGLQFTGAGYFLTHARTHRGTSAAPAVVRMSDPDPARGDEPIEHGLRQAAGLGPKYECIACTVGHPIVAFRPEVIAGLRLDELPGDPNVVATPSHAAFEDVTHP